MAARVGMLLLALALAACTVKTRQQDFDEWLRCSSGSQQVVKKGC